MRQWQCTICKYIHKGEKPPAKCPICGADASKFIEINPIPIPEKALPKERDKSIPGPDRPETTKPLNPSPVIKETGFKKIESLLLKHHAHPVSVHAPNGILPAAVTLFVLSWIFDYGFLSRVAFVNLIFVILTLPFVISTGILEWKKKYNGAMTSLFKLKIFAASVTCVTCVISIVWFAIDPQILSSPKAWGFIFINILMIMAAGIAGFIGGKLVFKD